MSETNAPTAPWLPSELDKSAEALIKEMEKSPEYDHSTDEPVEFTASGGVPVGEQTEETEQPASAAPEAPKSPETALPDLVTSKPEALSEFVRRELDLFRREEAMRAREAKLEAADLDKSTRRTLTAPEDITEGLRTSATATLEAMGLDPDQLVKMILADRLGDKAPPDLQREVSEASRDNKYSAKLRALEEKIASQERAAQARAYFDQVQAGAREYLGAPALSEHAPTVARVAKHSPDRVFNEIMGEIQMDAQAKAVRDPSAPLMTYDEAAKRVETRWSELSKVFIAPAEQNAPAEPAKTQPKTPQHNQGTIKAPDRPLAPWLQRHTDVEDAGIKAALAEYKRLQTPGATNQ